MLKNSIIKDAVILFIITLIAGVLLGYTNGATKEAIDEQKAIKTNQALNQVIKEATFKNLEGYEQMGNISEVYIAEKAGETIGYAFKVISKEGYAGEVELIVGLLEDGTVSGIDITKHSETPGLGSKADEDTFKNQYNGKSGVLAVTKSEDIGESEISAISGATITSRAVTGAVNEVLEAFEEIKGGK